jgi:hypothetical protein
MSAAFCAVFAEVTRVTWYRSGAVAHVRVTAGDRLPSPSPQEWVVFATSDAADAVMRDLTPGTPVFIGGQFHCDVDGATAIVRIFATTISVGVDRPDGPLFWEMAEARLPRNWVPPDIVQ